MTPPRLGIRANLPQFAADLFQVSSKGIEFVFEHLSAGLMFGHRAMALGLEVHPFFGLLGVFG